MQATTYSFCIPHVRDVNYREAFFDRNSKKWSSPSTARDHNAGLLIQRDLLLAFTGNPPGLRVMENNNSWENERLWRVKDIFTS